MEPSGQTDQLADLLRRSARILIFTGAGISTGSGIADFRGPGGVWTRRKPVYYEDFMSSEAARIDHWDYKLEAWPSFKAAQPCAAHHAIVRLEKAGKVRLVVTQNIDGLHTKAGTSRDHLVELHGTNSLIECQTCRALTDPEEHYARFEETRRPPVCKCGGFLKPATVSFGQNLRESDVDLACNGARMADLVIALGSSLSVYPASSVPMLAARRGTPYVIINRGETDHDGKPEVTLRLDGDVNELFPAAVNRALT